MRFASYGRQARLKRRFLLWLFAGNRANFRNGTDADEYRRRRKSRRATHQRNLRIGDWAGLWLQSRFSSNRHSLHLKKTLLRSQNEIDCRGKARQRVRRAIIRTTSLSGRTVPQAVVFLQGFSTRGSGV